MTDYPVSTDKHITNCGRGRKPKYPFKTLQVGHTFSFTPEEYDRVLWAMAQAQARSNGKMKFHISSIDLIVERIR